MTAIRNTWMPKTKAREKALIRECVQLRILDEYLRNLSIKALKVRISGLN